MDYQPWFEERVARYRSFFADDAPGQILVMLALWEMQVDYSAYGVPDIPLEAWDFETQVEAYAEHRLRALRAAIQIRREVGDDWVPFISPGIGIALNSVYYSGADMIASGGTTWVHPSIQDWDDLENLRPDPENRWFRLISDLSRYWVAHAEGDYVVQTFSHFAPMDMANALRGNALFTDFYDAPSHVHRLMERSKAGILWLEREQRAIVPDVLGGTVIWGTWVPGPAIFMSEDASDLCSSRIYTRFGRPYTEQISQAVGGCWIHHHARGYHLHKEIAQVPGLKVLQISRDPNCQEPIERLPDLYAWTGDVPLMTHCHARDVREHIDEMLQGRLILQLTADDFDEARETISFIRQHTNA